MTIMEKIKAADEGYELATIGSEFELDGDSPIDFLQKVIKQYELDKVA